MEDRGLPEPDEILPEKPKEYVPAWRATKESEADETYPESELLH